MNRILRFSKSHLFWLEELDPHYFVEVRVQRKGEEFNENAAVVQHMLQLRELSRFKREYAEENLWRSWRVFRNADRSSEIGPVPLVLDIDSESDPPNLDCAYKVTALCLDELEARREWAGFSDRLRVVFSGRKGFHIEVKPPESLDAHVMRKCLIEVCERSGLRRDLNRFVELETVLDPLNHWWLRLTGTLYSWCSVNGAIQTRRILPMSPVEFRKLGPKGILARAEDI